MPEHLKIGDTVYAQVLPPGLVPMHIKGTVTATDVASGRTQIQTDMGMRMWLTDDEIRRGTPAPPDYPVPAG